MWVSKTKTQDWNKAKALTVVALEHFLAVLFPVVSLAFQCCRTLDVLADLPCVDHTICLIQNIISKMKNLSQLIKKEKGLFWLTSSKLSDSNV